MRFRLLKRESNSGSAIPHEICVVDEFGQDEDGHAIEGVSQRYTLLERRKSSQYLSGYVRLRTISPYCGIRTPSLVLIYVSRSEACISGRRMKGCPEIVASIRRLHLVCPAYAEGEGDKSRNTPCKADNGLYLVKMVAEMGSKIHNINVTFADEMAQKKVFPI